MKLREPVLRHKKKKVNYYDDGTSEEAIATYVDPRSKEPDETKKTKNVLESDTDTTDILRKNNISVGRKITVKVSKPSTGGYDVDYELSYVNNSTGVAGSPSTYDVYVTYTPYRRHFKELPNIYLMYNEHVVQSSKHSYKN